MIKRSAVSFHKQSDHRRRGKFLLCRLNSRLLSKAQIGDVDGTAVVAGAATEFMLTRNVGLGLAYRDSDLDVDVTKGGFDGNLTWQMNSLHAYAQFKF